MHEYWTKQHNEAIRAYYYATTTADKNRVIDKTLHKPLYEMALRCLTALGIRSDKEAEQDIVIHLVCNVMPKLSEDKLQGALSFLWTSARNYAITNLKKKSIIANQHTDLTPELSDYVSDTTYPEHEATEELHKRILAEIDFKIKAQKVVNTTNSVFLLLLRDYILEHDYEVKGFGEYVMKTMHLNLVTYRAVAGRLNFRTIQFNEAAEVEKGYRRSRKVVGIKDGKAFIYSGVREAGRETGADHSNIAKCCLKKIKQDYGYYWFYYSDKKNWLARLRESQTNGVIKQPKNVKK